MRLTILAGLIMGLSLAVLSMLGAQARANVSQAAKAAANAHVRVVAPWYIATNDRHSAGQLASARGAVART